MNINSRFEVLVDILGRQQRLLFLVQVVVEMMLALLQGRALRNHLHVEAFGEAELSDGLLDVRDRFLHAHQFLAVEARSCVFF